MKAFVSATAKALFRSLAEGQGLVHELHVARLGARKALEAKTELVKVLFFLGSIIPECTRGRT